MATVVDGVTIKKEIEDPDSPDGQDSGQGQAENQSGQKLAKGMKRLFYSCKNKKKSSLLFG